VVAFALVQEVTAAPRIRHDDGGRHGGGTMRLVAAVLCGACLIVGTGCRSEEERAELRAAQSRAALLARLDPRQQRIFKTIERSGYRPVPIGVVGADVFAFREALGPGAALRGDPLDFLANQRGAIAAQWLHAPAEQRVFAAGFGADGPTILTFAEMMRADGYQVFSYDFCQGQQGGFTGCPSEAVGAYFATAGHAFLGTSEASVRSGLVVAEASPTPALSASARRAVLITPIRAATIGEAAATDFVAVEMATRPPAPGGGAPN
jgi:hypothetical protein